MEGVMPKEKFFFREVSEWQRLECIRQSDRYRCPNLAVLEAVLLVNGVHRAAVRCCMNPDWRKTAKVLAKAYR